MALFKNYILSLFRAIINYMQTYVDQPFHFKYIQIIVNKLSVRIAGNHQHNLRMYIKVINLFVVFILLCETWHD